MSKFELDKKKDENDFEMIVIKITTGLKSNEPKHPDLGEFSNLQLDIVNSPCLLCTAIRNLSRPRLA